MGTRCLLMWRSRQHARHPTAAAPPAAVTAAAQQAGDEPSLSPTPLPGRSCLVVQVLGLDGKLLGILAQHVAHLRHPWRGGKCEARLC